MDRAKKIWGRFLNRLVYLHRDENGQAIVFIALTLLLMVVFVMLVINTGQTVTGKVQMTNASDSSVIAGATWMARGLNTAAIINKTNAYLLSVIILTESMNRTHQYSAWALAAQYYIGLAMMSFWLTYVPGLLLVIAAEAHYVMIFGSAYISGKWYPKAYHPLCIDGLYAQILRKLRRPLWQVMAALTTAGEYLDAIFPVVAQVEAVRLGMINSADVAFLVPAIPQLDSNLDSDAGMCGKDRLCLPVVHAPFRKLCSPVKEGTYVDDLGTRFWLDEFENSRFEGNQPTSYIYHFPANFKRKGSLPYFQKDLKALPYEWTVPHTLFRYTPPAVVLELHQAALDMQYAEICSEETPGENPTIEKKEEVTGEECYKIQAEGATAPVTNIDKVTYKYMTYRYSLDGGGAFTSGDILDYYDEVKTGTISAPLSGLCPKVRDKT